MARTMRGCPTAWSPEGMEDPETNPSFPQQEEQSGTAEDKVTVDYDPDIDYEGSDPHNESVAQDKKEENSDAEYANIEIPQDGYSTKG